MDERGARPESGVWNGVIHAYRQLAASAGPGPARSNDAPGGAGFKLFPFSARGPCVGHGLFWSLLYAGIAFLPMLLAVSRGDRSIRLFEVTPGNEIVWEFISPFVVPSQFGMANGVFRAHRYGPDHPALQGKELDPDRLGNLNRLYGGR